MKTAEEIYELINQSKLDKKSKDDLHDWYREKHIKVTEESQKKLRELRQWRETQLEKLQKKVLRRLK